MGQRRYASLKRQAALKRHRAIVAVLSHGLRASELSVLNVNHWNGKRLIVHRSKGRNVSKVSLSREVKQHLEADLGWQRQIGEVFTPTPDSPMFLCQGPKHRGERLGYKGLYKMVKKLRAMPSKAWLAASSSLK